MKKVLKLSPKINTRISNSFFKVRNKKVARIKDQLMRGDYLVDNSKVAKSLFAI